MGAIYDVAGIVANGPSRWVAGGGLARWSLDRVPIQFLLSDKDGLRRRRTHYSGINSRRVTAGARAHRPLRLHLLLVYVTPEADHFDEDNVYGIVDVIDDADITDP